MKLILTIFVMIFICGNSISQVISVNVKNIQNFEHPPIPTNLAIKENKIKYVDAGTTISNYVFDLNKMKLFRNMDGTKGEFDIVEKINDQSILNVIVKFPNGQIANYIYQKEDGGKKTLICRWGESGKVVGWFDRTI